VIYVIYVWRSVCGEEREYKERRRGVREYEEEYGRE
jgi:hypothetical protein